VVKISTFECIMSYKSMKKALFLGLGFLFIHSIQAQQPVWKAIRKIEGNAEVLRIQVHSGYYFASEPEAWRMFLKEAPSEDLISLKGQVLHLPDPEGQVRRFEVYSYTVLPSPMKEKYKEIGTYWGRGIDDPLMVLRFDHTVHGIHAQVLHPEGSWYIDPVLAGDDLQYCSYYKRALRFNEAQVFSCGVEDRVAYPEGDEEDVFSQSPLGTVRRQYRIAVAATGEYTQFHGGTVAQGMSAIVTAMNRVNGIYEKELSVRMVLVPNNDLVVYTDAATDPYSNNNGSQMLNQNNTNLNAVIGSANYDIGHVFSTGGGGIAQLASVCTNSKAMGVTGLPNPTGDAFWVDYVCHEIGHQFNGSHTFNSSSGGCNGNRSSNNAYEPGSGSTIMAYAGLCSPDNVQNFSDEYFNTRSYTTIRTFITGNTGGGCATSTTTGNNAPLVTVPETKAIPKSTPIKLTAAGTDSDGDALTYCWEQYDRGNSIGLSATPTSGTPPLFRSFSPVTSPTRYFPRLQNVVLNTMTNVEKYATYARVLTFRVSVRDNKPNNGGVSFNSVSLNVDGASGPFEVTSQSQSGETWVVGYSATVTWNVANTDQSPVNCSHVNLWLSIDNGQTFPYSLASQVPNTGSVTFTVPSLAGAPNGMLFPCRVMVEASDNYFYQVNTQGFYINSILGESIQTVSGHSYAYPNPSSDGKFNFVFSEGLQTRGVYDLVGRLLFSTDTETIRVQGLDLSGFPLGMYFLQTETEGRFSRIPLIYSVGN